MTKRFLPIFFALIFGCGFCNAQSRKLPVPSKAFLEKARKSDQGDVSYLKQYVGLVSEKVLKKAPESKEVCARSYEFKNGIKMKYDECSESGADAVITFVGYPKSEIVKFVDWLFSSEQNKWNASQTKYSPKEDGDPGCYLEIKQFKDKIVLDYYCGC